jgi:hypothetical protein
VEVEAERSRASAGGPGGAQAARGVELMEEISAGLRGCAILDDAGRALAASGEPGVWGEAASGFLAAADATRSGPPVAQVHVATEDGEAFGLRQGELAMVAVTDRFPLASLVFSDMRAILRDLAAGEVVDRRAPEPGITPEDLDPEAAVPSVD